MDKKVTNILRGSQVGFVCPTANRFEVLAVNAEEQNNDCDSSVVVNKTYATMASYYRKFRLFLAYCRFIQVQVHQLTPLVLLSFMEFLMNNGSSKYAIANHLSAVKTSLTMYGASVFPFLDPRIKYIKKSLAVNKKFTGKIEKIIDIKTLTEIVSLCDTKWMGQIFQTLYLVAFFSFLRISNLVPHKITAFSVLEQLSRGDIFFPPPGLHILIKWSKTMQTRDMVRIIKLPALQSSPLCPGNQDTPLFQIKNDKAQKLDGIFPRFFKDLVSLTHLCPSTPSGIQVQH